jgi:outer membrane usher protein
VSHDLAALVSLRLPGGGFPPLGAVAEIAGAGHAAPVGYDGEVYLRGLAPGRNGISVSWPGGRCTATLEIDADYGRLKRLGDIACAP